MNKLLLLLVCCSGLFAESQKITLKNGAVITGEIIKESEKILFLDLGDDLLKIKKSDTVAIEKSTSNSKTTNDLHADIYSIGHRSSAPVKNLVDRVDESVVMVKSPNGLGSGVVISNDGFLLTNYHVIEKETQITVIVYKKTQTSFEKIELKKIKIVALQPYRDLALLQLDITEVADFSIQPAVFSADYKIEPGNMIFAIGSPLGLERTVTQGIVSSNMRNLGQLRFIQTDTAINPGNSGGPMFNARGEVVGLVCAGSAQFQGLGFGIPMPDIINFLKNRSAYLYDESRPQNGINYHTPPFY